ncbi:response regulator [Terrihabitans sp. B22-R8]|uniref:response regulator n=1 Tax=Terrihabitans sp. B22-R8 TaxID=3425128 RepID=UPI00403D422E
MLTSALEEAGMTVLVALDGDSALKLVEQITPDIILMDAVMPGIDGFETTRRLKRSEGLSHVPIIFMTGLTETEDVVRGLGAGGVDYVVKPIVPDQLIARIRVHLANARAAQSARIALDASGRFLLSTNARGDVVWATPQARRLLGELFPAFAAGAPAMPGEVQAWIATLSGGGAPQISVLSGDRRLQVSFLARTGPDELLLRIAEERTALPEAVLRERLSLTVREAEVLLWLARGKANKDIAEILDLSHRTVSKHLEQIFTKLGVENRASAAAVAIRTMADS